MQGIAVIAAVGVILALAMAIGSSTYTGSSGELDGGSTPQEAGLDHGDNGSPSESSRSMLNGGLPWELGLGAFVLGSSVALGVLYARLSTDDVLEGLRKDIYEHIEHNPGDHLAGITRRFNISSSSARHHLEVLEWSELIVSHKAEKMRHYYPNRNGYCIYGGSAGYKEVLAALRNPTSREMVKFLMGNERANQTAVAAAMDMHPSTVNWHAKRLIAAGIISRTREGKDIHYSLGSELDMQKAIALIEGHGAVLEDAAQLAAEASS